LDWLDADGQPRSGGAEAEYYAGLGLPYEPRNGVPALLEELLLVRDVSRQALFGADENLDYRVDAGESQSATALPTSRGDDDLPWSRLLTVTSAERNHSWEGQPRINLNERDLKKLHAQLVEALDQPWADFVIAYRQFGPAAADASLPPPLEPPPLRDAPGRGRPSRRGAGAASAGSPDLSAPPRFDIAWVLDLVGVSVAVPAGAKPSRVAGRPDGAAPTARAEPGSAEGVRVLRCPLRDDSPELFDQLPRIVDLTTTTDQAVIRGRVNINTAPRCVLLGIPGLDAGTADRILTLRTTGADASDLARRQGLWLLTEGLVDRSGLKSLWPYITGGGDVFRAQVVVQRPGSTRQARAEAIVDATQTPPRQVYWRDLTLRGGAISEDSLGRSASDSSESWSSPARPSGSSPEET
jgi:DNA uptake protein ComE-like DNA-binding protein